MTHAERAKNGGDRLLFYGNAKNTFVAVPIELKGRGEAKESDVRKKLEKQFKTCRYPRSGSKGEWGNRLRSSSVYHGRGIRLDESEMHRQPRFLKVNFQGKPVHDI